MLPGMMCDARLFAPQIAAFSGGRALHLPPLTAADTVEDLAAQVLADAPPRFALAGLSMGGIVAMEILRHAPDRVERLALLDTNPLAEADAVKERRGPQLSAVKAGGLEALMRDVIAPTYFPDGDPRPDLLDLCVEMALALGPDVFVNQSRALMDRPDQQGTLCEFAGPALVLMGEGDQLCPRDRHDLMHRLMPQSRLEIIQGAGHLTTLEAPEHVTAALARWLEE